MALFGLGAPLGAIELEPFETLARLPEARPGHAMIAIQKNLVVVGGGTTNVFHATLEEGSVGAWQRTAPLPEVRHYATVANTKDRIYVVAGQPADGSKDVLCGLVNAEGCIIEWERMAPLPEKKHSGSATIWNNHLYYVGNWMQRSVFVSTIGEKGRLGAWQETGHLPSPRMGLTTCVVKNRLHALGGWVIFQKPTDTILGAPLNADGAVNKWRTAGQLPAPGEGMASVMVGNTLLLLGGSNAENGLADSVVACEFAEDGEIKNVRTLKTKLPKPLSWCGAAYDGGYVYVSGGFTSREDSAGVGWSADLYVAKVVNEKGGAVK